MKNILPRLRRAARMGHTDRELLDALVTRQDEAAFEVLLRRHGPMVLAVCRRVLRNAHDAEDAFQATFLVLVRKASTIRKSDVLGSWLYGVAYRTAQKVRTLNTRRASRERQAAGRSNPPRACLCLDLDDELTALPEKYRVAIVLCELEGRSRKEVARELNIPEGTLSSRLATARKTLARQLRRHGWTVAGVPPLDVPSSLLEPTLRAAALLLAGRAATGAVSVSVLALTDGVMKLMVLNQLKAIALILAVLTALGAGTTLFTYRALAAGLPAAEEPQAREDPVKEAEADLKRAEADLAAAQAQLERKRAQYHEALTRALRPEDRAQLNTAAKNLIGRFQYRIPVETGFTENQRGARIEIAEVWGTRPAIEIGGQYLVRGKYVLPSRERGKMYFHRTSTGGSGVRLDAFGTRLDLSQSLAIADGIGPDLDLQTAEVAPGQGEFTMLHGMTGPGHFHVELHGTEEGKYVRFANVYFGTRENVWRGK